MTEKKTTPIEAALEAALGGFLPRLPQREVGEVRVGYYSARVFEGDLPGDGEAPHMDTLEGLALVRGLAFQRKRAPGPLGAFQYEGTRHLPRPLQENPELLRTLEEFWGEPLEGLLHFPEEALPLLREIQEFLGERDSWARAWAEIRLLRLELASSPEEAENLAEELYSAVTQSIFSLTEGPLLGEGYVDPTGEKVLWWGKEGE